MLRCPDTTRLGSAVPRPFESSAVAPPALRVGLAGDGVRLPGRGRGGRARRSGGWVSAETTVASYAVRGSVNGITLDLGAADAEIVGGGDRPAIEVRRTDRFAFGRRAVSRRDGDRRRAEARLALPADGARRVLGALPADRARQRAGHDPDDLRERALQRLPRLRAGRHRQRATSAVGRVLRLRAARPRAGRRRQRRAPRARWSGWSCARAPATSAPSCRPAATRSTRTSDDGSRSVRGVTVGRGRAVPDPGALQRRRRDRGGERVSRRRPAAAAAAAPPRRGRAARASPPSPARWSSAPPARW